MPPTNVIENPEIVALCQKILDENPKQVEAYLSGKTGLFGFFMAAVMKENRGSENPKTCNEILQYLLDCKTDESKV